MDEIIIHIEAEVNPTESEEKVKKAIENLFGNIQTTIQPIYRGVKITAQTKGTEPLTKIYNILRRERIRDAARKTLLQGLDKNRISFCLNKQVAFAGHVSFCQEEAESPLGPIKIRIESDNPREIINWLTSKD
ncbi:MAG TPA: RNA-binding domain-containing protein [Candidatus Acidoferrum sp.]|jgi:predicted RNA binding protein with dsRBD fold (UPF0201 family)|nr:RNA-binding domain-containing protein [Candidatus Acidoferrum sp.]